MKYLFSRVSVMQGNKIQGRFVECTPDIDSSDQIIDIANYHHGYHCHDFYEIELYLAGSGTHYINSIPYDVKKGYFYILSPMDSHQYRFITDTKMAMYSIQFLPEVVEIDVLDVLLQKQSPYAVYLEEEDFDLILSECRLVEKYSRFEKYNYQMLCNVVNRLCLLMVDILSRVPEETEQREYSSHKIIAVRQFVQENYGSPLTIHSVAEHFDFSDNYFGAFFKKHMGVGFTEYLTGIRLSHAAELLISTNMTVGEIAGRTGFSSPEYLARMFRKQYGQTPVQYRSFHKQT